MLGYDGGMNTRTLDTVKQREIVFGRLHPDPNQAESAAGLLGNVTGILELQVTDQLRMQVCYDLNHITLRIIEEILMEVGFHLDSSLLSKLKRALYYYTEEVQLENLGGAREDVDSTQKVFVNRYQRLRHGCRDDRPLHWRKYL